MWHLKKDTIERWCWAQPLTKEGCDKIVDLGIKLEPKDVSNGEIQKNKSCLLPINDDTRWIFETCSKLIIDMNKQFFEYDLDYISALQFNVYDGEMNDFYVKHMDTLYESTGIRKLSFSIQLSESDSYEGGELQLHYSNTPDIAKKDKGTMTIFPSYSLNEITPVTKGTRYELVGWVIGPKLK